MPTVLVVEDEAELNQMICDYLTSRGHETIEARDGAEAVRLVFERRPDIMLLDLNLPVLDGLNVARTIRAQTNTPIIMATARGDEEDRIDGFETGADDYVVKPFSLPELALRIDAILRRSAAAVPAEPEPEIVAGDLRMNTETRRVFAGGHEVELTAAQFAILRRLAEAPGRVFSRMQLLECMQADPYEGYERTIDVHIKNIRKAIEENPHEPLRIVTVRGVGYRLENR